MSTEKLARIIAKITKKVVKICKTKIVKTKK